MMFGTVASKRLLKSYINIKMVLLHVIKRNFLQFVVGYDFCPTSCVFSIPSLRDIKHTTHWRKIISNHKPWDILYIYIHRWDKHISRGSSFCGQIHNNICWRGNIRAVTSLLGTGSRGLLNWENYHYFGKLRNTAHLLNEEQNSYFVLNL